MKKPRYIWGVIINMGGGLWGDGKVYRFSLHKGLYGSASYYNNSKIDFSVDLGYHIHHDGQLITFASTKKKEAELFLLGAESIVARLKSIWDPSFMELAEKLGVKEK